MLNALLKKRINIVIFSDAGYTLKQIYDCIKSEIKIIRNYILEYVRHLTISELQ